MQFFNNKDNIYSMESKILIPALILLVFISGCTSYYKCGIENCHGLEITCGPDVPDACTEIHMAGDLCRKFASCERIDGECTLVTDPGFETCKSCVQDCIKEYESHSDDLFDCEYNCFAGIDKPYEYPEEGCPRAAQERCLREWSECPKDFRDRCIPMSNSCGLNCGDYSYGSCPEGCKKECVPSMCDDNLICTDDCSGPLSCRCPVENHVLFDFQEVSIECTQNDDCVLKNRDLGIACCWEAYCQEIDYSEDKWVAVNWESYLILDAANCKLTEGCGPPPGCADQIINDNYKAVCEDGICTKAAK